jgi:hypothetical protein
VCPDDPRLGLGSCMCEVRVYRGQGTLGGENKNSLRTRTCLPAESPRLDLVSPFRPEIPKALNRKKNGNGTASLPETKAPVLTQQTPGSKT